MGDQKHIKIFGKVIDLLFPPRCPICHEINNCKASRICGICKDKIPYIKEARCKKCGKEVISCEAEYCYDCLSRKHYFDEGLSLFKHDKSIRNSIYKFKYDNKREYADFYADEIVKAFRRNIMYWDAEVLVPVPLYNAKKLKRGFNQAEVLAKKIGKATNIKMDPDLLIRSKETISQKELSKKERSKNLEDAFKLRDKVVQYKKVILIDDIYTTGATLDSCAKVLKEAHVDKIYFITISIGDGF